MTTATLPGTTTEHVETIIIGGGQAGLSMGYHLQQRGRPFLILDANARTGDTWRNRWDSLKLFTPARFSAIDGMKVPRPRNQFITKDEMGDYLEEYARNFALPIRHGTRVDRLSRDGDVYEICAGSRRFTADNVVVAMGKHQTPKIPSFATKLDPSIRQLHSVEYRNPGQLQDGPVLIVGAGNSGAEIGKELALAGHEVSISGRNVGQIPFGTASLVGRAFAVRLVLRVLFHRVLTVRTPMGRKMRATGAGHSGPLIRVKAKELRSLGIERVPVTEGVEDGKPLLSGGTRVDDVANVIWCTGFNAGFNWIDLPVFEDGDPRHRRGVVDEEPGLYFVGLEFLYSLSSEMIHGVGRDAEYIAKQIDKRTAAPARAA